MQTKISGNIETIRAIEDCIRATKKYTEGINTIRRHHPIQGEDFSSKAFSKYYEVYPEIEISWNMPVNTALDWLWCDTPCINIVFFYDYRNNNANVRVSGGDSVINMLTKHIPKMEEALRRAVEADGQNHNHQAEPHIHVARALKQDE